MDTNLNRRVTIQVRASGVDAVGQPSTTWTTFATVWASIVHRSGLATIKSDAEASVVRTSIRIRYRTDVTPAMRVLYGTDVYQIDAVLPDLVNKQYVDLVCARVV